MVGRFEVGYFEFDVLCPKVLFCTKCDSEGYRANWCRRITENNAVERGFAWSKQARVVEAHLRQCACEDQVVPASAVDEYSSELGSLDNWIKYQRKLSCFREASPLIIPREGDETSLYFNGL